jgi:hypothetical protein
MTFRFLVIIYLSRELDNVLPSPAALDGANDRRIDIVVRSQIDRSLACAQPRPNLADYFWIKLNIAVVLTLLLISGPTDVLIIVITVIVDAVQTETGLVSICQRPCPEGLVFAKAAFNSALAVSGPAWVIRVRAPLTGVGPHPVEGSPFVSKAPWSRPLPATTARLGMTSPQVIGDDFSAIAAVTLTMPDAFTVPANRVQFYHYELAVSLACADCFLHSNIYRKAMQSPVLRVNSCSF